MNPPAEVPGGWSLAWSPDDRYLYFLQKPVGENLTRLFRAPVRGGTRERAGLAAEELGAINISPDGTRIAFSRGMIDRPEIWMLENYLWFRSVSGALNTIAGYEAMHMIRKGQIRWLAKGDVVGQIRFIYQVYGIAA